MKQKAINGFVLSGLNKAKLFILHDKNYRTFLKLYNDNYFVKSVVQMAPAVAPFIENAFEKCITDEQRKNFLEFIRVLESKFQKFKVESNSDNFKKLGIEQSFIERVVLESDQQKIPYFANALICFYWCRNLDNSKSDVFPRHYLDVLTRYTSSHIEVLKELARYWYTDEAPDLINKDDLRIMGDQFQLRGGVVYKILMDFYRDGFLVLKKYEKGTPTYGLGSIEYVHINDWGCEFIQQVICPPWEQDLFEGWP